MKKKRSFEFLNCNNMTNSKARLKMCVCVCVYKYNVCMHSVCVSVFLCVSSREKFQHLIVIIPHPSERIYATVPVIGDIN